MNNTVKAIKKEEENYIKMLKLEKKPEDIKNDQRDESFIKRQTGLLLDGFSKLLKENKVVVPAETKVHGEVTAKVEFPKDQKVHGELSIVNQKELPDFKKIFNEAIDRIKFPEIKETKVEFPKDQKVHGEVTTDINLSKLENHIVDLNKLISAIEFPEIQKVVGEVKTDLPIQKGENVRPDRYVPVRMTNGKAFIEVMSQTVSSSGRVVEVLERIRSRSLFDSIVDSDRNLQVVDNHNGLAIAEGKLTGVSYIHKFGKAPDFDTGDGFVDVWDGANDGGVNLMRYTYSTTADINRISSDSASDTFAVEVQGLDASYNLVVQTITLTGTTPANLTTPLIRVFRMKNVGSADNVGRVFCFVNVATTGGVPNTLTNIRAIMQIGNNQTLMAKYTVPSGYTAYMRTWYASLNNNVATSLDVEVRARPFGGVFQLKSTVTVNTTGVSTHKHDYFEPEKFTEKTDIVMRTKTAGQTVASSGGFDLVLVANS